VQRDEIRDQLARGFGLNASHQDVLNAAIGGPAVTLTSALELPRTADGAANTDNSKQLAQLNNQLAQLSIVQQTSISNIAENSRAVLQNTVAHTSTATSALGAIGDATASALGGGFAISPILSGLLGLFGGSNKVSAPPLLPFTLPPPVKYEGGIASTSGQVVPVSYGEREQPRPIVQSAPAQVIVQVNAMDSKSFSDHSDEIALAVRRAILTSNSLSDVISDL